jgi:hypothetical protein
MIPPEGVYQPGVNIERTRRVNFKAPLTKPKLEWSKDISKGAILMQSAMVDGLGGVWYINRTITKISYTNELCRLDSKGNLSAKKKFPMTVFDAVPVISLNEAVICIEIIMDTDIVKTMEKCAPICLECIDLNGKTIWRTDTICSNASVLVYRIPKNRIMLYVNAPEPYQYNIYSLADGKLLESIILPDSDTIFGLGPFELSDGSWITLKENDATSGDLLACFDSNHNIIWYNVLSARMGILYAPFYSGDIAVVGTKGCLRGINLHDGTLAWEQKSTDRFIPAGIMPDGNFLIRTYTEQGSGFAIVTDKGKTKQSFSYPGLSSYSQYTELAIYQDGEILFGYMDGIALVDSNGSLIWNIDLNTLGMKEKDVMTYWQVNPLPDNRIVASCNYDHGYHIFSFKG